MIRKLLLIVWLSIPPQLSSVYVQAQDECGVSTITQAESLYDIGRFKESIYTINSCLIRKGFDYSEKVQAYRLLSMSYLAMDSVSQADENISRLLLLKDNFEGDARDPERFRLQVNYIRYLMRANLTSAVSKKAESIELAPATIQIVSAEDIINRGYKSLDELFRDLPAFDISRTSGLTAAAIFQRGYRTAANTDRTQLLIDGVENNEMWSNAAFITGQYSLSNIKRVEVVYGPASTIYGANAFVGVINIITKNEEDFFKLENARTQSNKNDRIALSGQAGTGSRNTRFGDVTLAARTRNAYISVTGRAYVADETDLSSFPDWDNKWSADEFGANRYQTLFTQDLTAGRYQVLNQHDPSQLYFKVSADSTKIVPTALAIHKADSLDQANYQKGYNNISTAFSDKTENYYIASKLRFGDFQIGSEYQNWSEGAGPDYVDKYYAVSSDLTKWQVRQTNFYVRYERNLSERLSLFNFTYFRTSDFNKNTSTTRYYGYANAGLTFQDFISGREPYFMPTYFSQQSKQFRTETRANLVITEKLGFNAGVEIRNGLLQGDYVTSMVEDPITTGTAPSGIKGSNYYSTLDIGVYGQLSFQDPVRKLNLTAAGRVDNNRINSIYGYGTVFNPRLSIIYYPTKFIFKAIYSEAFLDASVYNKFATSSARLVNNPNLAPERVRNVDLSARYTYRRGTYVELVYYKAHYNNILATVNIDTLGVRTTQYQSVGKSRIQGVQIAAEALLRDNVSVFANGAIIDPITILPTADGGNRQVRIGDISGFSANVGINAKLLQDKLNLNMRVNYVGNKPTGKNTSISGNPYTLTEGYTLFNSSITYSLTKKLALQLTTNNIFDVEYFSPGVRAASGVQSSRVPQQGRTFMVRLIMNSDF